MEIAGHAPDPPRELEPGTINPVGAAGKGLEKIRDWFFSALAGLPQF
jgi:hypothetical protein